MSLVERLRVDVGSSDTAASLAFDERIVTAIGCDSETGTSQERYKAWRESQVGARPTEYLLPRVVRRIECEWPGFMHRAAREMSDDELRERLAALGPWYVPFALGDVNTMEFTDDFGSAIFADDNAMRMQFRTELIGGTIERLFGDELAGMSVLDIGCNSGWFRKGASLPQAAGRCAPPPAIRPRSPTWQAWSAWRLLTSHAR